MTNPHDPNEGQRTLEELRDEIIKRLDEKYDLVYVDYRDRLSDEQVETLARKGAIDEFWDSTWEFESDSRHESEKYIIEELLKDIVKEDATWFEVADEFLGTDEWIQVQEAIEERDRGNWPKQLASQTPAALMRVLALDEDHGFPMGEENPTAEEALTRLGLAITPENVKAMDYTLNNADPHWDGALAFWIFGLDVETLYEMPIEPELELEVVNPYVYIGNPYQGDGFISEKPLEGTVRIKRGDLTTDKGAFGYPVNEIYGGLDGSQFAAEIRVLEPAVTK